MLICSSCGKIIANVTPYPINYGICANCPTPEEDPPVISMFIKDKGILDGKPEQTKKEVVDDE